LSTSTAVPFSSSDCRGVGAPSKKQLFVTSVFFCRTTGVRLAI
jgi:hypothetical protein